MAIGDTCERSRVVQPGKRSRPTDGEPLPYRVTAAGRQCRLLPPFFPVSASALLAHDPTLPHYFCQPCKAPRPVTLHPRFKPLGVHTVLTYPYTCIGPHPALSHAGQQPPFFLCSPGITYLATYSTAILAPMYWKSDIWEMFGRLLHASTFPGLRSPPLNSCQGARGLLPYPHHFLPSERDEAKHPANPSAAHCALILLLHSFQTVVLKFFVKHFRILSVRRMGATLFLD